MKIEVINMENLNESDEAYLKLEHRLVYWEHVGKICKNIMNNGSMEVKNEIRVHRI